MSDKVLVVISDALRWDYAFTHMYGELFDKETWARMKTKETFTAPCVCTMMSGLSPEEHGVSSFNMEMTVEDNLLNNHNSVMFSWNFGEEGRRNYTGISGDTNIRDDGVNLPTREQNKEGYIIDFFEEGEPDEDLVVYHSKITHKDYGRVNTSYNTTFTREDYEVGVEHMIDQMNDLMEVVPDDWVVIFTSDHGEGLGERGTKNHVKGSNKDNWVSEEKHPWLTEVPVVVNREIEIPTDIEQNDFRSLVEFFLGDYEEVPWDYEVDEITEPVMYDQMSDELEDRLQNLGYL